MRKIFTTTIVIGLLFLINLIGCANVKKGILKGKVTDTDNSGLNLGGVIVTSSGFGNPAITDSSGNYEFSSHPTGNYNITATKISYESLGAPGISFSVSNDNTTVKDFTLPLTCKSTVDADGDGYGNPGSSDCANGNAYDCDDINASINPGAIEVCNDVDDDCDGNIDGHDNDGNGIAALCDNCPNDKPARVVGVDTDYFNTLQAAYDWAINGEEIQCHDKLIDELSNITFNDPSVGTITFRGGFDCSYTPGSDTGITTVNTNMTISEGTLIIESGTLKLQ